MDCIGGFNRDMMACSNPLEVNNSRFYGEFVQKYLSIYSASPQMYLACWDEACFFNAVYHQLSKFPVNPFWENYIHWYSLQYFELWFYSPSILLARSIKGRIGVFSGTNASKRHFLPLRHDPFNSFWLGNDLHSYFWMHPNNPTSSRKLVPCSYQLGN